MDSTQMKQMPSCILDYLSVQFIKNINEIRAFFCPNFRMRQLLINAHKLKHEVTWNSNTRSYLKQDVSFCFLWDNNLLFIHSIKKQVGYNLIIIAKKCWNLFAYIFWNFAQIFDKSKFLGCACITCTPVPILLVAGSPRFAPVVTPSGRTGDKLAILEVTQSSIVRNGHAKKPRKLWHATSIAIQSHMTTEEKALNGETA